MPFPGMGCVVARALAAAGSDEQKSRFLPALIAGRRLGTLAATEPTSGFNPLAITTKAVGDGNDFIVNGTKTFITGAEEAEVYLIIVRTDQSRSLADLSALIIEKGTPGFSFGKKEDFMGLRGASDGELIFQDCRIPRTNLLGPENGYLAIMPRSLWAMPSWAWRASPSALLRQRWTLRWDTPRHEKSRAN